MIKFNISNKYFLFFILLITGVSFSQVKVSVAVQKELYPFIAKYDSEGKTTFKLPPVVSWTVQNTTSKPVKITLTSEIPSWTYPASTTIDLNPNEIKEINQTPFGPNLMINHPETPVKILIKAKNKNSVLFNSQKDITIKPAGEMVWSLNSPFDTAPLIAAWVTPDNFMITSILLNDKPVQILRKSITASPADEITEKVKSIVRTVSSNRFSYLTNTFDFKKAGFNQQINLPQESLTKRLINNVDASVLLASLFEKSGLDPLIILLPGHAIVGVRMESDTSKKLFIEPSIISSVNLITAFSFEKAFETAVKQGESEFKNAMSADEKSVEIIDIKKCRKNGISPLW